MKARQLASPWGIDAFLPVTIFVGLFIVADIMLVSRPWFLAGDGLLLAMALPLCQCSLASIWATNRRTSPYLRFALPPAGAVVCWYVIIQILPWGANGLGSAAWAICVAIQAMAILIAIHLFRVAAVLLTPRGDDGTRPSSTDFTFNLRTLMLWTTVSAIVLGFVQYGRVHLGWSSQVAQWEFVAAMPVLGVFNGLLAVFWLWALIAKKWIGRCVRIAFVLMLIGSCGYLLPFLIDAFTGTTGRSGISRHETLVLAAGQTLVLVITLGVALAARFAKNKEPAGSLSTSDLR